MAVSADQNMRAIATLQACNTEENDVLISVRLSPASEPLMGRDEERTSRVTFPHGTQDQSDRDTLTEPLVSECQTPQIMPDELEPLAIFSSDSRFLSCLVPPRNPTSAGAAIAVFPLSPTSPPKTIRPNLPSYIHHPPIEPHGLAFASVETIIHSGSVTDHAQDQFTSMEDISISCRRLQGGPSVLVVGCQNGNILGMSYRPLKVIGVLYSLRPENGGSSPLGHEIRQMKHVTEWSESNRSTGKLATLLADGSIVIFTTLLECGDARADASAPHFPLVFGESSSSRLAPKDSSLTLRPIHRILGQSFVCAEWLCGSYLALMRRDETKSIVESYAIATKSAKPISLWQLTAERLLEDYHAKFPIHEANNINYQSASPRSSHVEMQFDPISDCLAISGSLPSRDNFRTSQLSFACVWNWRSNVEGLLIAPMVEKHVQVWSALNFCRSGVGATKLVHTVVPLSPLSGYHVDVYETAVLSARSSLLPPNGSFNLEARNNLLLSFDSISYPQISLASAKNDLELEWNESVVPPDYVRTNGALQLACIGRHRGRSVAVASSRGFCTMDVRSTHRGNQCVFVSPQNHHPNHGHRRGRRSWRRFGKVEEDRIKVLAFSWWEAPITRNANSEGEDLLIAIIEVKNGDGTGTYLSCWSPKSLDFDHQLIFPISSKQESPWGVALPTGSQPSSMQILEQPIDSEKGLCQDGQRKAILLISSDSLTSRFYIYQLQLVFEPLISTESRRNMLTHFVLAHYAASNEIGSPTQLLLLSGSFGFDFRNKSPLMHDLKFVATLGVIRYPGEGLDCISVDQSAIVAVGPVLDCSQFHYKSHYKSEVVGVWHSDYVKGNKLHDTWRGIDYFVYLVELTDGSFFSWFVPCATDRFDGEKLVQAFPSHERKRHPRFIHKECLVLGYCTAAGKSSLWLHKPPVHSQKTLRVGATPGSVHGCALGAGQAVLRLHRSLGEQFETELFRVDFLNHEALGPSDLHLSFPFFGPSFYSQLLDALEDTTGNQSNIDSILWRLEARIRSSACQDVCFKSLQLLLSRLVEYVGSLKRKHTTDPLSYSMVAALVEFSRSHMSPLHFAGSILEIGRHLEPCHVDSLFPLPMIDGQRMEIGETVMDLLYIALDNGSVSIAASSLPLLVDNAVLKSTCQSILQHCLETVDKYFDSYFDSGYYMLSEEQLVASDVLRYSFKLVDAVNERCDETDSSDDELAANYSRSGRGGFSIFCGLFGYKHQNGKMNGHLIEDVSYAETVGKAAQMDVTMDEGAALVSQYLNRYVFQSGHWKKAAALAMLLIGESTSGLAANRAHVASLAIDLSSSDLSCFLRARGFIPDGLSKFFQQTIKTCEEQLDSERAGRLLDIIQVLLNRSVNLTSEMPGLVVTAWASARVAGRITEIMPIGQTESHELWDIFMEDQEGELHSEDR